MRKSILPLHVLGFGLASFFAVTQEWSLPAFCWGTWLTGLAYAWSCVLGASLRIILTARSEKSAWEERLPFLRLFSPLAYLAGVTAAAVGAGFVMFRVYGYLFGFYGLFLSVFAEMEPLSLFGRNGFINSDFYTPLTHLALLFWPMVLGALVANVEDFYPRKTPWKRLLWPFEREILRMHLMVLALPFFSLLAWAVFRDAYQTVTVVLLLGIFYLLPWKRVRDNREAAGGPSLEGPAGTGPA